MDKHLPTVMVTLTEGATIPEYQTAGAAGADIRAFLPDGDMTLASGSFACIPTGLRIAIPSGFEAQVRPRSGLAAKYGVTVLNAPGTIDCDYRGEVGVILINHGPSPFIVHDGDRIAQLVIARCEQCLFETVMALDDTHRGSGGFGSTGT